MVLTAYILPLKSCRLIVPLKFYHFNACLDFVRACFNRWRAAIQLPWREQQERNDRLPQEPESGFSREETG